MVCVQQAGVEDPKCRFLEANVEAQQKKPKQNKKLTKLRKQITSSQAGRHNTRQRMMAIIDRPRKTEGLNTESDNEGNYHSDTD